jgi:uncharacterized protein VirK/YbjX
MDGDRLENRGTERSIWEVSRMSFVSTARMISYIWNKGGTSFRLRACLKVVSIIWNLRAHLKLLHVIALPHTLVLARRHHRLAYRYLNPYLALGFCQRTRLNALTSHYAYLQGRVNDAFLMQVYDESPAVWHESLEGRSFTIQLSFPKEHDCEGDLRLDFKSGSVPLYAMTFTITPGRFVGADEEQVLLITAIQGQSKKIDLIKEATKICNDTSPPHLLLAAAQGIALSLDITAIAGVSAGQQISREDGHESGFVFDYDGFWKSFMGDQTQKDFYQAKVPFPEKPLELLRANRRARAIRRRRLRGRVTQSVCSCFNRNFLARATEDLSVTDTCRGAA